MHIPKKGLRALGIAESFAGREHSTVVGVVMRKDLRIDGFCSGRVTVGGTDATDTIMGMIQDLDRRDINVILISGCVIAWFNVIDPGRIADDSGIPVICVTYEESDGLLGDLQHHFPGDEARVEAYLRLGEREPVDLGGNRMIYLRAAGIGYPDAARLCRDFTLEGKIPEPLRVARLCARQIFPKPRSS
jgi:uncharacterized protein